MEIKIDISQIKGDVLLKNEIVGSDVVFIFETRTASYAYYRVLFSQDNINQELSFFDLEVIFREVQEHAKVRLAKGYFKVLDD